MKNIRRGAYFHRRPDSKGLNFLRTIAMYTYCTSLQTKKQSLESPVSCTCRRESIPFFPIDVFDLCAVDLRYTKLPVTVKMIAKTWRKKIREYAHIASKTKPLFCQLWIFLVGVWRIFLTHWKMSAKSDLLLHFFHVRRECLLPRNDIWNRKTRGKMIPNKKEEEKPVCTCLQIKKKITTKYLSIWLEKKNVNPYSSYRIGRKLQEKINCAKFGVTNVI